MRRPLHCLLVGFLIFSLSVDTARACWRLRHAHRGHAVPACPVEPGCGGWSAVVVADVAVGCGWAAYPAETAVVVPAGCFVEEIGCGQPLDCCGGDVDGLTLEPHGIVGPDATTTTITTAPPTVTGEILTARPAAPGIAPAAEPVGRPEPLEPRPTEQPSIVSVSPARPAAPGDQPVEPASATAPADPSPPTTREVEREATTTAAESPPELSLPANPEPESPVPPTEDGPPPAMPAATPAPVEPPAPAEPNLFEEVDAAPSRPATPAVEPQPAAEEPPQDPPPDEEPSATPATDPAPAAQPMQEPGPAAADEVPRAAPAEDAAPVEDAAPAVEPEPAADPLSRSEPNRRWIDASGRYAVVGALVAVLDGRAEIRKPEGGSISVPLDRLSPFDRAYAEEAGRELATAATTARPTETAAL